MKNLTSPYGNIEYNYNQDSQLTGYLRGYANNDWRVNTCFDYDLVGKLTSITNIAQPTLNNLTDTTNKVKSIFIAFVYDSQGRLNSYKAQVDHSNLNVLNWQDSRYIAFNYNSRGQLTNETHKYGGDMPGTTTWSEMVYNYDTAGSGVNLTGIDRQLPGQIMVTAPTMTFDANNRIVDDVDSNYYFNSDTGNPTTYNGKTMNYDMEDRLTRVVDTDNYSTVLECGYYADGKRAWKCGASTGWEKTYYIYEGDLLLCEVKQPVFYYQFYNYLPAYVSAVNLWGADGLAGRVEKVSAGTDANDLSLVNPITNLDNYAITWYAYDQQGTVAQRFNADGTLKNVYACDAFGNTLAGVTETYSYNAKYGYYFDAETGFYYCTHRYYDPQNGRWLTEDPIGFEGGLNLYGYCGNGPVGSVDPSGFVDYTVTIDGILIKHLSHWGKSIGHHLISWVIFTNQVGNKMLNFNGKFAEFCNNMVSGPLDPSHQIGHGGYIKATIDIVEDMKGTYGNDLSKWGIIEAKELMRRVLTSTDDRITNILKRIPLNKLKDYAIKAGIQIEKFGIEIAPEIVPKVVKTTAKVGASLGVGTVVGTGLKILGATVFIYIRILNDTAVPLSAEKINWYYSRTTYYYEKTTKILWQVEQYNSCVGEKEIRIPFY